MNTCLELCKLFLCHFALQKQLCRAVECAGTITVFKPANEQYCIKNAKKKSKEESREIFFELLVYGMYYGDSI